MMDVRLPVEINRRLIREDPSRHDPVVIDQADIAAITAPVVILGDPGLGKSVLTQAIGRIEGFVYVRAASLDRNARPENLLTVGQCLVLDGLDEVASATGGDGVDKMLTKLSQLKHPRFILSCREADWRGASDRVKIEDDYGEDAVVLHLLPFDRDDATLFLSRNFPGVAAERTLDHLAERGLDEIFKNPLTLRLIGEIATDEDALPSSRAELLDRACRILVREENERHQHSTHAHSTIESLLLAAGAHAATQLFCNLSGAFRGPEGLVPDGYVHVGHILGLPHAESAANVLHTRIFEAEGNGRFRLLHRVLAEFLGAQWLATCFRSGASSRRIFRLFGVGEGVPTSLRGLHAWIAHFDHVLAEHCITADPYAVLRYGDADTMPAGLARKMIAALARLSERDPYFRAEDWGRHPAAGLMKPEFKDDILAIIGAPGQHTHLTMLLVEAMIGSDLAASLSPALTTMMSDRARSYGERKDAADALRVIGAIPEMAGSITRLLAQGDEDSTRLAWDLIDDVGLSTLPMRLVIEGLFAYIGITVCETDRKGDRLVLAHLSETALDALDSNQLRELLDLAREYAKPLFEDAGHSARAQVADLVTMASRRALELAPSISASQLWYWIEWIPKDEGYNKKDHAALEQWLGAHPLVRLQIQAHVILDVGLEKSHDRGLALYTVGLGLYPTASDILALIEEYVKRRGKRNVDLAVLEELVLLGRRSEGLDIAVRALVAEITADSPVFLAKLDEWSKPIIPAWKSEHEERAAKARAERHATYQTFRDQLAQLAPEVNAGAPNLLYKPAKAYLGRFSDFDRALAPEDRVRQFLGDQIGNQVLEGFKATLKRNDLPTARSIAEHHAEGKQWFAEVVLVCGIAERLRLGIGISDLSPATREAAFMAWRRCGESNTVSAIDMKPLEAETLTGEKQIERFFRDSIEPQLERQAPHVQDLYYLAHDARWHQLAGRLAIEWLRCRADLTKEAEADLLACACRHAELSELQALARLRQTATHRDHIARLTWLSLDFLADFAARRIDLKAAASEDPTFLWLIRDRVFRERNDPGRPLTVQQHAFIVEQFSTAWPRTGRAEGTSSGNTNPWNATETIEHSIYALAGLPQSDATTALNYLIETTDPSYIETMRHALALQLRARRDAEFVPMTLANLTAATTGALPASIDDMRAFFGDRIDTLRERMLGSNTDMWRVYWQGNKPHTENYCRDRLIDHISGQLPEAIQFVPEMQMPLQGRADIAAVFGRIGLPVEIKRQWHREVWAAPIDQLAARYMHEWHAEGRGVYIVLWFGMVEGKAMPVHPGRLPPPQSAEALQEMLVDLLPQAYRDVIDVYVVDVTAARSLPVSSAA